MSRKTDFSTKTRRTLAERSGFICNAPWCKKVTIGPHSDPNRSICMGQACHIEAASQGGPRYNSTLMDEQIKSIDNGIWLCNNCAVLIDRDPQRFTVKMLRSWRAETEYSITHKLDAHENMTEKPIIAIANFSGGVAKSFATAAFSYILQNKFNKKPLIINTVPGDHATCHLNSNIFQLPPEQNYDDGLFAICKTVNGFDTVLTKTLAGVLQYRRNLSGYSQIKESLYEYLLFKGYDAILCDCGTGGDQEIQHKIFSLATDIVIPLGDNINSYRGADSLLETLCAHKRKHKVWFLYSLGNSLMKLYGYGYHEKFVANWNGMENIKPQTLFAVVPKSSKVRVLQWQQKNVFASKQASSIIEAYNKNLCQLLKLSV